MKRLLIFVMGLMSMAVFGQGVQYNGFSTNLNGPAYSSILIVDATNGVDGTAVAGSLDKRWKTLTAAMTAAPAGALIWVAPGTYDSGTNLYPRVPNITVRGSGMFQTIFTSEIAQVAAGTNMACLFGMANNDVFEDFQIFLTVTNTFGIPIGTSAGDATATNAVGRRLFIIGQSDCVMDASPNVGNQIFYYDSYFLSGFDCVNHLTSAGQGTNFFFNCIADSSLPGWGGARSGIGAQTGYVIWQGGMIRCISDTAQNYCIGLKSQNGRIMVVNALLDSVTASNLDYLSGATPPYNYTNLTLINCTRVDSSIIKGTGKVSFGFQNISTVTNTANWGVAVSNVTANSSQYGDGTNSVNFPANGVSANFSDIVQGAGGFNSQNGTAPVAITTTGYTNSASFSGIATVTNSSPTSIIVFNGAGTPILTNELPLNEVWPIYLQAGGKFTAAGNLAGQFNPL